MKGINFYGAYAAVTSSQETVLFDNYVTSVFYLRIKINYALGDPNDYYFSPFFTVNKLTGDVIL